MTCVRAISIVLLASSVPAHAQGWSEPSCVAYRSTDDAYACLDFSVGSDDGVERPIDFETFVPPTGTSWEGRKAIVLLGRDAETIVIAEKPYDPSKTVMRVRSERTARQLASRQGFRDGRLVRRPLKAGTWNDLAGVQVWFESKLHEGDASAWNIGSLKLRCGAGATEIDLVDVESNARSAIAFAPAIGHAPSLVIGTMEWHGGEGSSYYSTRYLRVDLRARCDAKARR
jgi:hypothetical protein